MKKSAPVICPIHSMPGHLIRRLNQHHTAVFRDRMTRIGVDLTSVQYAALETIEAMPDLDQATLAASVAFDKVTIGGVIERLVSKGYVDRRPSPLDRRAKALRLTEQGSALVAEVRSEVSDLQDEILAGLTPDEQDTFTRLLSKATRARETDAPQLG